MGRCGISVDVICIVFILKEIETMWQISRSFFPLGVFGLVVASVTIKTLDVSEDAFPVGPILHEQHVVDFQQRHRPQRLVRHAEGDLEEAEENGPWSFTGEGFKGGAVNPVVA